jgi:hypothetical protein
VVVERGSVSQEVQRMEWISQMTDLSVNPDNVILMTTMQLEIVTASFSSVGSVTDGRSNQLQLRYSQHVRNLSCNAKSRSDVGLSADCLSSSAVHDT